MIEAVCGAIAVLVGLVIIVPDTHQDVLDYSASTRLHVRLIALTIFGVCIAIAARS
ncbi:hypothetical protein [Sphingomonas parapaucimobilis]|uniref:Uncharacterized protein n=1 Tax=Sphingomonas parapaucimobilis NBRC 15100 TaxID=1219049 RepID=A0A0A1W6D5_9SPHN|nr:hypothetical protein [Sphingomonas parapaucimobilis]GAM00732.1 hypothetical protein SP5_035_01330 [Sphingomonas parapaucimobilis NBRC 15100]